MVLLIPLAGNTKFADGWDKFWSAINGVSGDLLTMLAMIGAVMAVAAFIGYLWQRRHGGGNTSTLIIMIIIGAVLASPATIIPGVLRIIDWGVAIVQALLP